MSINSVNIMGRLTRDPELKTAGDSHVCRITVAVDDRYKRDKAYFFEVTAWRATAEFISRYFHKGDMIAVTGSLSQDAWDGADGAKKTKTYILADNVSFCGGRPSQPVAETPERASAQTENAAVNTRAGTADDYRQVLLDEDLPF